MDYLACVGIKVPKLVVTHDLHKLLSHLKLAICDSEFINLLLADYTYYSADDSSLLGLPVLPASAALTLLSPNLLMEPIKTRLPVVKFGAFQDKHRGRVSSSSSNNNDSETEEEMCAICLSNLERSHEMRELSNCCHAFHKSCLDRWMDQHQITCPTCRSSLLPILQHSSIAAAQDLLLHIS